MKQNWEGLLGRVQGQEDLLRATALKEASFQVSECSDSSLHTFCPPSHPSPPPVCDVMGVRSPAGMSLALPLTSQRTCLHAKCPVQNFTHHQQPSKRAQSSSTKSSPRDQCSRAENQPTFSSHKGQVQFGIIFSPGYRIPNPQVLSAMGSCWSCTTSLLRTRHADDPFPG